MGTNTSTSTNVVRQRIRKNTDGFDEGAYAVYRNRVEHLHDAAIFLAVLAVCAAPVLLAVLIVRSKRFAGISSDVQRHVAVASGWIEKTVARIALFLGKVAGVLFVLACCLAVLVFFIWLIKTIWYAV